MSSHVRQARSGARRAPNSPPAVALSTPTAILQSADSWPGWSSSPLLGLGRDSRNSMSRVEANVTPTSSGHVASPSLPVVSVPLEPEVMQE
ncbi:hypothetical protein AMTR_s00100p00137850 [Amborella trichopoda]|uniref:Uncharacterized protein n=1 Tax=Amborella trichopoda TaxID=13333 RepID=W1NXS4_AMBTC|nr:hypothetical protein AMTR_s00100p00137850 [Amborella trichopoda]